MSKVLKANAAVAIADAVKQFPIGAYSEVFVEYRLLLPAASLTFFTTGNFVQFCDLFTRDAGIAVAHETAFLADPGFGDYWFSGSGEGSIPPPSADTWMLIQRHWQAGGTLDLTIDGTLVCSVPADGDATYSLWFLTLGIHEVGSNGADAILYIDDVKVGSTLGGSDIFADDFESGTLAAWTGTDGDVSVVDFPPVPPPPPRRIRTFVGSPWRIIVTDTAMRTISVLDRKATQRQFLFTLNGPAYHTGQVASDDPDINIPFPDLTSPAVITHNRRLLYALRRETGADPPYVCRFAGIITNLEDQGADAPTSRYTAYDPWQYMMSRPFRNPETGALPGEAGYTFPAGTRASDIAMGALIDTEVVDGETYIYTDGTAFPLVEETDPLADPFTVDAGLSVGEVWQQLCATGTIDIHLPPMYEPFDAPGKLCGFQTVRQSAGVAAGPVRFNAVMNWDGPGHSLASVDRLIDGTRMANAIQYFDGETAVPLQTDSASIAAYGQWWAQQFFPGGSNAGLVELMALAEVQIRKNGARSISLDPAPERTELPLRDYGLGDYLPTWASRNLREPLGIDYDSFDPDNPGASGFLRIFAIPIELDDDGTEMTRAIATASEAAA